MPLAPQLRRPYLAAPERRRHLLEAAAEITCSEGWEALTMQGVAGGAGVSRQLVYQHFASLDELHAALLVHLFETPYEQTRVIASSAEAPQPLLRRAFELFLEMPERQRRLLRALASGDRAGRSELGKLKRTLRRKIARIWTPFIERVTDVSPAEGQALAWMLIMAAWGLSDLMRDREIERAAALDLFLRFADGAIAAAQAKPKASRG